jgi:tRNA dimethylallyltransferase
VAEEIALQIDAQLVNCDAFQIYRGMNVGTAKPNRPDLYRLVDIRDPNEQFGVGEYVRLASTELQLLFGQHRNAVLVGGTGLYVRALTEGYEDMGALPNSAIRAELQEREIRQGLHVLVAELQERSPHIAANTDLKNPVRVRRALEKILDPGPKVEFIVPNFRIFKLATSHKVDKTRDVLHHRTITMFQNGWKHEVRRLMDQGYGPDDPGFRAIGYRTIADSFSNPKTEEELVGAVVNETVKYAKRQETWLRSEPRLFRANSFDEAVKLGVSAARGSRIKE